MIKKADRKACYSRQADPLPTFRENSTIHVNDKILCYMRRTRGVVVKMHEVLRETNEEIKSLIRSREDLEQALEHVRKDKLMNKHTVQIRTTRPVREKEIDGADKLVEKERALIYKIKKILEKQLREAQKQILAINEGRQMILDTLQERNRVLDLINVAASSVLPNVGFFCPPPKTDAEKFALGLSKPPDSPKPNPLSPYTPEAYQAMKKAQCETAKSKNLRKKIATCIGMCELDLLEGHRKVNFGVQRKIDETSLLDRHLHLNHGRNRTAVHRQQRHCDLTDIAEGYTLGPVNYNDLMCKETLTRPLVKTYQRHVGGQLPEADNIINASGDLEESRKLSLKNKTLLRLTKMYLKDDIVDKELAMNVDAAIIRLRKRRSNHRWVMEGKELLSLIHI